MIIHLKKEIGHTKASEAAREMNAFLIDENGIIEEVITDVKTKKHTEQILS